MSHTSAVAAETPLAALPRHRALLLLGPTGSGKTPLGELLQRHGLWGRACRHFDFGANLRQIVAENRPDDRISAGDIEFLRMCSGPAPCWRTNISPWLAEFSTALLPPKLSIAQDWLVLNGLPRHVGQARVLENFLSVEAVIRLECTPETVMERIWANSGGDRTDRPDDSPQDVVKKMAVFSLRTVPLVNYYEERGTRVETISVTPETGPDKIIYLLETSCSQG